jgi:hypothetical protein
VCHLTSPAATIFIIPKTITFTMNMHKPLLLFYSFFFFCSIAEAQNLVLNPSFEEYNICPDNISQMNRATGWLSARPTCDYFNVCAPYFQYPINCVSVPLGSFGYRTPSSGDAFAGIISKAGNNIEDREIVGGQLITPLQIGTKYYASFKVSLIGPMHQTNRCGINKLGILFSTVIYDTLSPAPICNCAQVHTDSIITDTLNWTRITGSFVADSNYSYINIGRFFPNSQTDSIQVGGTLGFAYYFLDDVCVSTDSAFAYNYTYVGVPEIKNPNSEISLFPNPTTSTFTLHCPSSIINSQVTIYNSLGEKVHQQLITSTQQQINLHTSPGIYILQAGSITKKITVIN